MIRQVRVALAYLALDCVHQGAIEDRVCLPVPRPPEAAPAIEGPQAAQIAPDNPVYRALGDRPPPPRVDRRSLEPGQAGGSRFNAVNGGTVMPPPFGSRDFLVDPAAFMDANIVVPVHGNIGIDQGAARIHQLCLSLYTGATQGKKHGVDVPVFTLRRWVATDPADQGFYAYWCPYDQNQTFICMLGNGARFMFTATMDGCSFGVGSQNGGSCRVAHANKGGHGGALESAGLSVEDAREQQRLTQRNMLWSALGDSSIRIIQPGDYMADIDGAKVLKSTTFGVHNLGRPWKFYTQRYWKIGTTMFLREVTDQI
jgi:hypothetical protein